jgi:hypothetical protein
MSEHAQTLDMLARILAQLESNQSSIIAMAEALAGVRAATVAKVEAGKAIDKAKEPAAPAPSEAPAPASAPTTYEDIRPVFSKLLAAKGAPVVVKILASFGVKKGQDLPTDKLADALAAATSALES